MGGYLLEHFQDSIQATIHPFWENIWLQEVLAYYVRGNYRSVMLENFEYGGRKELSSEWN